MIQGAIDDLGRTIVAAFLAVFVLGAASCEIAHQVRPLLPTVKLEWSPR